MSRTLTDFSQLSNGLFTVTYDEKFSEDDSAFFSLSIKDFRYWW